MKPDEQYSRMAKTRRVDGLIYAWAYIAAMPLLLVHHVHPARPCSPLLVSNIDNAHTKKRSPTWPVPWLEANLFPFQPML
jgi:hypothetical protein